MPPHDKKVLTQKKVSRKKLKNTTKTKTHSNWLLESMPLMQIGKKIVYSIDNWCKLTTPLNVLWFPYLAPGETLNCY